MKKVIVVCLLLIVAVTSIAVAGPATPLVTERAGNAVQGPAPNPLTTYLISDNCSHTTALYPSVLWFALNYGGAGTCQIRLMNTSTKSSWVQVPIPAQSTYARVVHPNTLFLNYSGCNGASGSNSVLEMM